MEEIVVDARGEVCPKPLILTKKALTSAAPEQPMRVLIDNETSRNNVMRFLADNGVAAECIEKDGVFSLLLNGTTGELHHPDAETYCSAAPGLPHVIVIKSNRMGIGDDELGTLLLKAFINTIPEVSPLPGSIVFYNSGVFMTTDDSPVIEALRELEKRGISLLICGTCTNFYQIQEQIHIGTISNMYTILETVTTAGKVIEP
jgi:selenium metabolism protein YedF